MEKSPLLNTLTSLKQQLKKKFQTVLGKKVKGLIIIENMIGEVNDEKI